MDTGTKLTVWHFLIITSLLIGISLGVAPLSRAQTGISPAHDPAGDMPGVRFEAASIRHALSPFEISAALRSGNPPQLGTKISGDRVEIGDSALVSLLCTAYSVEFYQIHGPSWLTAPGAPRFNISAKLPPGATAAQLPEMLRALLEERFHVTAHRESIQAPVYELVQGPKGHKLAPAITDEQFFQGDHGDLSGNKGKMVSVSPGGDLGPLRGTIENGVSRAEYAHITMAQLAHLLSGGGRPVTDATGLQGAFHVIMERDLTAPDGTAVDQWASTISAIERLGLKLESRKGLVEQIVIDHVEKDPTAN